MDERVQKIYQRLQKREYRSLRNKEQAELSEACKSTQDLALRSAKRLTELVQAERAILFPEDRIGMMRTVKNVPQLLCDKEKEKYHANHFVFDGAQVCNISSDYEGALREGFDGKRARIRAEMKNTAREVRSITN